MNQTNSITIYHNLTSINWMIFILPLITIISELIVEKSYHHITNILPLSGLCQYFPEYRIILTSTVIYDLAVISLLFIKDKVLFILSHSMPILPGKSFIILKYASYFSFLIGVIGQIFLLFPYDENISNISLNSNFYKIGNYFFFIGMSVFILLYDRTIALVYQRKPSWGFIISIICSIFELITIIIYGSCEKSNDKVKNVGYVFQNIGYILIFLRLFLFHYEMPYHSLKMTSNRKFI